jgi:selenocysteine-specific elongation factor
MTLGGGRVLQPVATRLKRRHTHRTARLELLRSDLEVDRANAALYFFGWCPWTDLELCRDANLSAEMVASVLMTLNAAGILVELETRSRRVLRVHRDVLAETRERVEALVIKMHAEEPLAPSVSRQRLIAGLAEIRDRSFSDAIVQHLISTGRLLGDERSIVHPGFRCELTAAQSLLCEQFITAMRRAGFQPPEPAELGTSHGISLDETHALLDFCAARGTLVRIDAKLYLSPEVETELQSRIRTVLRVQESVTVSQIRDLLGTSRKFTVPLCEYLDRIGLTRRTGDLRTLT